MTCMLAPTLAQETTVNCDAVDERIVTDHPIDLASCDVEVAEYSLDECTPPTVINATRPTSYMILAIDASGSMAGKRRGAAVAWMDFGAGQSPD